MTYTRSPVSHIPLLNKITRGKWEVKYSAKAEAGLSNQFPHLEGGKERAPYSGISKKGNLFVCTIECCLRKLKLDYRQKCIISLIFHMLVIQMARLYFERLVLICIYSGWGVVRRYTLPEGTSCTLKRLGRNVTSGESNAPWHPLGRVQQHLPVSLQAPRLKWILQCPIERTPNRACDSQTTYHHAAATSLPVNRGGHLLNIKISLFDKN